MSESDAFGLRMRELRSECGVSQDDLARRTGILPAICDRPLGARQAREPRLGTILRIARGLGVRPGELLDPLVGGSASAG